MKTVFLCLSSVLGTLISTPFCGAQTTEEQLPDVNGTTRRPLNFVLPTFGGEWFWSDESIFRDWRIQRNTVTGHYRLLDGNDRRYAWGEFDDCVKRLERIRRERNLAPMKGKVVILLHGIVRSRDSMEGMARYLSEKGDYTALNVTYASTQQSIADHAATLKRLIDRLDDGVDEIDFVAHSMGNLVIRHYLGDSTDAKTGKRPDPRIKRIVMLAPPNNGTRMAHAFRDNELFRLVWGVSGKELAEKWPELSRRLATPQCEFGIIAGDGELFDRIGNPLLAGKNDFVVSIEETRLIGARDFAVLPVLHSTIMDDEITRQYTLSFLRRGYFVSEQSRRPVREIDYERSRLNGNE
jgi:pimeloyl-ACP methyl ester carboxylesterase